MRTDVFQTTPGTARSNLGFFSPRVSRRVRDLLRPDWHQGQEQAPHWQSMHQQGRGLVSHAGVFLSSTPKTCCTQVPTSHTHTTHASLLP